MEQGGISRQPQLLCRVVSGKDSIENFNIVVCQYIRLVFDFSSRPFRIDSAADEQRYQKRLSGLRRRCTAATDSTCPDTLLTWSFDDCLAVFLPHWFGLVTR